MTRSEINAEFLDPPCRPDTMAFHSARTALFSAVKEVAPLFRGRVLDLACGGMPYREMLMCDGRISEYKRIFPFYKMLIRTDHVPKQFDGAEGSMFSGLSMLARKSEESE